MFYGNLFGQCFVMVVDMDLIRHVAFVHRSPFVVSGNKGGFADVECPLKIGIWRWKERVLRLRKEDEHGSRVECAIRQEI